MFDFMIYNVSYEIAGLILMAINIFIMFSVFKNNTEVNKKFTVFCIMVFVGELLDVVSCFTISLHDVLPVSLNELVNLLYFATVPFSLYFCFEYIRTSVKKSYKILKIINYCVLGAYGLIILTNYWTNWLFYFNGTVYTHGRAFMVSYAFIAFFIIELVLIIIMNWKKFRYYQKVANVLFPFSVVICIIFQAWITPNTVLTYFGASISGTVMLFSLESPDFQELEKLRGSLEMQVKEKTKEADDRRIQFENLTDQTIEALGNAVDALDKYTIGHSHRVAAYTKMICIRADISKDLITKYEYAALLHDTGKIGIDRKIIRSSQRLTDEEYEEIKKHTIIGSDILKGITSNHEIARAARWHHERWDGKGYPDGLSGEQIPEVARIIAVADCYDTMASKRPYRDIMPQAEILKEFEQGMGTQFDPEYCQIMIDIIKEDKDFNLRQKDFIDEKK